MLNKPSSLTYSLLGSPLTLARSLTKALYLLFIAALVAALANMPTPPMARAATAVDDTATTTPNTPVTINVLANDIDDLDAVFANYFSQRNRVCLGNGAGSFIGCADVSTNTQQTMNVSPGDVNNDGNLDAVFGNLGSVHRVCLG
ncbi:MAG: FG-GAP repeat domain-containing protein, partial [Anaerolineae bacterium]